MKPSSIAIFFVAFFCTVLPVHAEVYTWVDKEGKKHYGDKVPAEYLSKSSEVSTKTVNTLPKMTAPIINTPSAQSPTAAFVGNESPENETKSSCAQLWSDFEASQRCFSKCVMKGGGINVAKCDNCKDLPRPNCEK